MKLKRCPKCGELIDVDELEDLDPDTVIGCGLKEGKYMPCAGCGHENDPDGCKFIRDVDGLTETLVSDLQLVIDESPELLTKRFMCNEV